MQEADESHQSNAPFVSIPNIYIHKIGHAFFSWLMITRCKEERCSDRLAVGINEQPVKSKEKEGSVCFNTKKSKCDFDTWMKDWLIELVHFSWRWVSFHFSLHLHTQCVCRCTHFATLVCAWKCRQSKFSCQPRHTTFILVFFLASLSFLFDSFCLSLLLLLSLFNFMPDGSLWAGSC